MTPGERNLDMARDRLDALAAADLEPDVARRVGDLRHALGGVNAALTGQLRIVAVGPRSSLKSSTLEALVGRPGVLPRAARTTTAVTIELHLVPTDGLGSAPRRGAEVLTLTERGAERRVALAGDQHGRSDLMRRIEEAAAAFGFGSTYPLDEYRARGGSLAVDGHGAALVERVVRPVAVAPAVWDLSWAGAAQVVLVDTPGPRPGGLLDDLMGREQTAAAHVVIELVAADGERRRASVPDDARPRLVVLTRLESVRGLDDHRTTGGLEDLVRSRTRGPDPSLIAVSCPPWAYASPVAWREHHADTGIWLRADDARRRWSRAAWPEAGPTGGALRNAVAESLADGGAGRLRAALAGLCATTRATTDEPRLARAVRVARVRADGLAAGLPPVPVVGVRPRLRDGYRGSGAPATAEDFATLDLRTLAARAVEQFDVEAADILAGWLAGHGTDLPTGGGARGPTSGVAAATADAAAAPDADPDTAALFARLGGGLVDHVARRQAPGRPPPFLQIARVRHELTDLLERLLVDRALPDLDACRWAARAAGERRADDPAATAEARVAAQGVRAALRQLAPAEPG